MGNNYFINLIKEINDLKNSLEWVQGIEQSDEWIIESLKSKREKLDKLKKKLIMYCAFEISSLTEFLKDVLERFEGCKYEIIQNGEKIIIQAIDKQKPPIIFPCAYEAYEENNNIVISPIKDGNISQVDPLHFTFLNCYDLDFLNQDNEIIKTYPYLKDILSDLVGYQAKVIEYKMELEEKDIFAYVRELISINYSIKDGYNLPSSLKVIAKSLIEGIIEKDTDYLYKTSLDERVTFYDALINGDYNDVANKKYWFSPKLNAEILSKWHAIRQKQNDLKKVCGDISSENYIVFKEMFDIFRHMQVIEKENGYYISLNGHNQTPATPEEKEKFEKLIEDIISRNYNWREAREISRNASRLNVWTNYKFPHNIDDVIKAFNPKVVTFYDKYETISLTSDLTAIQERALMWAKGLTPNRFSELFQTSNKDAIDEYLKRMILSQFDIPKLVHDSYGENFKEKLEYVKEDLETSSTLSEKTCQILFSDEKNNKELYALAFGVLVSLCQKDKITDILETCKKNQNNLNCKAGIVGYSDVNTLRLPNGQVITSLYCEDIPPYYDSIQKCYEFYYDCPNDLEFIEGCVEIFGDVLMTQIFRIGNKRTAKCLFNELLISRGILPPILDLNENERILWDNLTDGRFDRYPTVKNKILQKAIEIKNQIQNPQLQLATTISLDALNRQEFNQRNFY